MSGERGKMEAEATEFAMRLLVPSEFLKRDLKAMGGIDIERDAKAIGKLAQRYHVSEQVMLIRIGQVMKALTP